MNEHALQTLKTYFGYDSFRPGQDRMVDAVLAGRDALGVMLSQMLSNGLLKIKMAPVE